MKRTTPSGANWQDVYVVAQWDRWCYILFDNGPESLVVLPVIARIMVYKEAEMEEMVFI